MIFSPRLEKAIQKASILHRDQERKANGVPYISHLFAVALILSRYTKNEDTLIGGILHDTVEDTTYTPQQLRNDFGAKILRIVMGVTEPPKRKVPSWQKRKDAYLRALARVPKESLMVCAADKISNLASIRDAYTLHGKDIWKEFSAPSPEKYLWYHGAVLKILQKKLKNPIVLEYERAYRKTERLFAR